MNTAALQAGNGQILFQAGQSAGKKPAAESFIAVSPVMRALVKKAKMIARGPSPALILGAPGSGRKALARLALASQNGRFKTLRCHELSGGGMEAWLSGKNSPGGADSFLGAPRGGGLLIEEADLLPLSLQDRLLRLLQSRRWQDFEFFHGSRILFSADESISVKIKAGLFMEELFSRLSHNLLIVPPLSERKEDIPELASYFLREAGFKGFLSREALEKLKRHPWKGNLKELRAACLKAARLHKGRPSLAAEDFPLIRSSDRADISFFVKYHPKIKLDQLINFYISMSLRRFQSKKESAKALGISVKTIYNKIQSGAVADFSKQAERA